MGTSLSSIGQVMELKHIGDCGQLTRVHIEIKATRKGAIIRLISIAHALLGWYFSPWEARGGKGCSHNCVSICTSKDVGLANMCAEASHYGNFEHANSIMDHHNPNIASMFVAMKGGLYRIQ